MAIVIARGQVCIRYIVSMQDSRQLRQCAAFASSAFCTARPASLVISYLIPSSQQHSHVTDPPLLVRPSSRPGSLLEIQVKRERERESSATSWDNCCLFADRTLLEYFIVARGRTYHYIYARTVDRKSPGSLASGFARSRHSRCPLNSHRQPPHRLSSDREWLQPYSYTLSKRFFWHSMYRYSMFFWIYYKYFEYTLNYLQFTYD